MASIDRPRGKPRVRWRDPDGTAHARSCATEKAARELCRLAQHAEDTGRTFDPAGPPRPPALRAIGAAWIAGAHRRLAPRTVDRLAQMGDAFLDWMEAEHGKGCPPATLSRLVLERYWDHLRTVATGRYIHRRTDTTARKHVEAVMQLWTWAYDREEYEAWIPRPRRPDLPRPAATTPRPAPTWSEMDAAISASDGWRRCALVLLRCTGLRVGQVMALQWSDVDVAAGTLTVRGELGKPSTERRGRVVPLPPVLLEEWATPAIATWSDAAWIVPCPHPHRTVRARDIARCWRLAGVRVAVWTGRPDHSFRAGYQSSLREDGVARETTEYLVGHALPGQDAAYVDPERALHLRAAVAKVPPICVVSEPAQARERA